MPITIVPLKPTRSELLKYVKFGINLYKDSSCYVPPLILDEIDTLSPKKNPDSMCAVHNHLWHTEIIGPSAESPL